MRAERRPAGRVPASRALSSGRATAARPASGRAQADRTPVTGPERPTSSQSVEVSTMNEDFENFNVHDEEWLTELENRAADLQNELFVWVVKDPLVLRIKVTRLSVWGRKSTRNSHASEVAIDLA